MYVVNNRTENQSDLAHATRKHNIIIEMCFRVSEKCNQKYVSPTLVLSPLHEKYIFITTVGDTRISCWISHNIGEVAGVRDEEQDFTGESGFSASSRYYDDHDAYCVVDLWRRPPATRSKGIHCV